MNIVLGAHPIPKFKYFVTHVYMIHKVIIFKKIGCWDFFIYVKINK